MAQLDNTSSNPSDDGKAARDVLRSLSRDLKALQDDVSGQLNQDIIRLQGTKHRLLNDIEILEEEYQSLRQKVTDLSHQKEAVLSRQQLAQQQLWAKRLAQALASHLQQRLTEDIYQGAAVNGGSHDGSLHNAYQLLSSLDSSLNDTLHSLQQDLNSYQSSLSQQISRMHSMEQQGEAILEALIDRLSSQLQQQMVRPQMFPVAANGNGRVVAGTQELPAYQQRPLSSTATGAHYHTPPLSYESSAELAQSSRPSAPTGRSATKESTLPKSKANPSDVTRAFRKGLIFIILSTLALSFHNVMVGLIGYGGEIFGRLPVDGIFPLNIPNSLMLLWLRMLVVLPLMVLVANQIYPKVWSDIRKFLGARNKRPLFQVIASGCFLFMSQVLIYKAISDIGPGVAVTLLFMYPLITVPLAWLLFGDRPTPLRGLVMFAITVGIVFTALPRINTDLAGTVSPWGVLAGLLSSAAFALYLVSMQLSFRKLHPVPVSLVQFTTIFVLTSLILIGGSFFGLETGEPSSYAGLYLAGLLLGGLTLLGYLFNNYGVRLMGAAQASIVASSGPVLTAILAYVITPGDKSMLQSIQWIGVILVTLGVLALSLEKLKLKRKRA